MHYRVSYEAYLAHGSVKAQPHVTTRVAASASTTGFALAAPQLLDAAGRVLDNETTLRERQFRVGTWVKSAQEDKPTVFGVIQAASHHEVTVYFTSKQDGDKALSVPTGDFLKKWALVMDAAEMQDRGLLASWPLLDPTDDVDCQCADVKFSVTHDVFLLWKHFFGKLMEDCPLMIGTKPRKHVFTTRDVPANSLMLVPYSPTTTFLHPDKVKNEFVISLGVPSPKCNGEMLYSKPLFVQPKPSSPNTGSIILFWGVERLDASHADSEDVNMLLTQFRMSTATVFPRVGEFSPSHVQEFRNIPVLTNTDAIKEGTTLKWCDDKYVIEKKPKSAPVKASKKMMDEVLGEEPSSKKSRGSDGGGDVNM